MEVDAEVIDKVAKLAVAADHRKVELIDLSKVDPSGDYLMRCHSNNTTERVTPAPTPRKYAADRLDDIVGLVRHFAAANVGGELPALPAAIGDEAPESKPVELESGHLPIFVWVSERGVEVVLGENGRRRDRITLVLVKHVQFSTLDAWAENHEIAWRKHPEFIHLLRVGLNAEYSPTNLIDLMRNLRFKSSDQGGSSVVAGGGSLGRAVEARAMGVDESGLIEDVVVAVPVYQELAMANEVDLMKFPIRCSMDVDPSNSRMRLVPKAGEMGLAVRRAQAEIVTRLRSALGGVRGVSVFRGDAG